MKALYNSLFLILLILMMVACSDEKADVQPPVDEPEAPLTTGKPPNFMPVPSSDTSSSDATSVIVGKYCWEEEGKICDIEANDPEKLLLSEPIAQIQASEKISFTMAGDYDWHWPLIGSNDYTIEKLVQTFKGEEKEIELTNKQFLAPEEPGRYYYLAKVIWDGELKGQANYAFAFSVQ